MNSKVSILIPLFNSQDYIAETIQSALDQTWPNIEIIIVDDGSTDNSYQIAKNFESDILKIYQQKNRGACAARNLAFQRSTGDFIQYLDADDLLTPDKIKKQLMLFEKFGNNIITSGQWGRFFNTKHTVQWEDQTINKDYLTPIDWLIESWNGGGMAQTSVWLTPRNLIDLAGSWNESLTVNQDGEFFSRVLMQANAIKFCSEAKVYYRSGNASSISQRKTSEQKAGSLLNSYLLHKENINQHLHRMDVRKALANNLLNFIYQHHKVFPILTHKAEQEFKKLNIGKMWPVGGHRFKQLAKLVGFKNALKLHRCIS